MDRRFCVFSGAHYAKAKVAAGSCPVGAGCWYMGVQGSPALACGGAALIMVRVPVVKVEDVSEGTLLTAESKANATAKGAALSSSFRRKCLAALRRHKLVVAKGRRTCRRKFACTWLSAATVGRDHDQCRAAVCRQPCMSVDTGQEKPQVDGCMVKAMSEPYRCPQELVRAHAENASPPLFRDHASLQSHSQQGAFDCVQEETARVQSHVRVVFCTVVAMRPGIPLH